MAKSGLLNSIAFSVFGLPFSGVIKDVRGRLPYYLSDWTDAWNYRVVPATIFMYFANLLPAISFAQDMFDRTDNAYGVNEVLLASAMGGIVFGLFAGQPLCIVGVTGPISIFNYTVYDIIAKRGIPYFPFMCWICLWAMVMHFIIAIFNWINSLRYVTLFSCDIFGFFICIVYIQKGIQICTRQFGFAHSKAAFVNTVGQTTANGDYPIDLAAGYYSVALGLLMVFFGLICAVIGTKSKFFAPSVRKFIADYGTPLTVVFFSGFVHFGSRMEHTPVQYLPTTKSFAPTSSGEHLGRAHGWFIHFWHDVSVGDVFLAFPFAVLLTLLFLFDHNVSSLIAQDSKYKLKKPASFHWDFFLLGITTGLAGILGIPAPNGLIPQAPLHTESLCIPADLAKDEEQDSTEEEEEKIINTPGINYVRAVEQRFSNTFQGLMILGTMSGPLLVVLGLVPQAVLAGLFWIMGISGLMHNGITFRLQYMITDKRYLSPEMEIWTKCSKRGLYLFTIVQIIFAGAEVGITESVAAIGFPGVLLLSVIVGYILPKYISKQDMEILDRPTAPGFVLKNLRRVRKSKQNSSNVQLDEEAEGAFYNTSHETSGDMEMNMHHRNPDRFGQESGGPTQESPDTAKTDNLVSQKSVDQFREYRN